jgi:hypothetical protein
MERWPMGKKLIFRRILTALLFIALFGLIVWINYSTLAVQSRGMADKDFMSLWTGGKAIVLGLNPYDTDVWQPLRAAYGSHWRTNTQTAPFPLWTFVFFVPFSFLTTQAAGSVWMTLCEFSLILGISLILRASDGDVKGRAAFFLLALGAFLFRPVFPALGNGQLSPVLFLLLAAAYALYERGHPFAAGFVLAFEATKPNLTAILLLTVGLTLLARRDWRALAGLVMGGLVLLNVSWIILPGWLFEWLAITHKARMAFMNPTMWGLAHEWGGEQLWPASAIGAGLLFYLVLVLFLWKQREGDWIFSLGLAVIASTFLAPYLWVYEQVVLLFPTVVALNWGLNSKQGSRRAWWAGWWFTTVVLSWLLLFAAYRRGVDSWSALMPLAALGYLMLAWHARRSGEQG